MEKADTTENDLGLGLTILVVEDDEGLNRLVSKNLERAGFRTASAARGADAIEKVAGDPDVLLLLDYRLPDMTANQVVEQLVERQSRVPFIVMTGQGDERIAVEMMKLGALDYVVKDASFMDVLPQVVGRVARQIGTEKRLNEAEAKLRESQRSSATLMSNLPGMVYRCRNDRQRTMTFVSEGSAELTGHHPSDLVENEKASYMQLLHPDDKETVLADIQSAVADKRPFHLIYRIHSAKDGEKWVWERGSGVFSTEGEVQALEGFITDITDRRRAEDERQRMEQQLQLAGRLAAVGELAAGVAHELNNPLTAVQAYAQYLSLREDIDEAVREDVGTIYKEAQRATRITANLLSFARRHKPAMTFVSINEVVEESLGLHGYRMKVNNVELLTELAPDLPRTMADFHQLQQVFVNIITNAEHAMTETRGEGVLVIRTQMTDNVIRTSFTDDGPGAPDEDLKRIFDPFFTTKDVGKGTGLGLSICYGIIEGHGGRVYAKNNPDRGMTFVVEIPVTSEAQSQGDESDSDGTAETESG